MKSLMILVLSFFACVYFHFSFLYICHIHVDTWLSVILDWSQVKKLEREKKLDAIVDKNLNNEFIIEEVEMIIQVALLCTQSSPEDRPAMSDVVRMLEGEGLAERWEEWQSVEVTRRQESEWLHGRFGCFNDSIHNQDAIELSGGRWRRRWRQPWNSILCFSIIQYLFDVIFYMMI